VIRQLLIEAGLDDLVQRAQDHAFRVAQNGSNLSAGEKQLVCICRAILRNSKVIILDEATANIDVFTEQKILKLIQNSLKQATVITIAHRLNTVI
jgi:ABC-type multidrug transport system fused ATPase/permease subunit